MAPLSAPPNEWTRFGLLLVDFIFGYILLSDARFQLAVAQQWLFALVIALATSAVMFAIAWPDDFDLTRGVPMDYSWRYVGFWTLFALSSWSWLVAWLGFGQRMLNVNHPLLKPAAAMSFPLYLLHPLVMLPALLLISQWQAAALPAFSVLTASVLLGTLALAALLKHWPIACYLLGLKSEPALAATSVPRAVNSTAKVYRPVILTALLK